MIKGQISILLRQIGLMFIVDKVRYHIERFNNRKDNKDFKRKNPDIKLPPDYLIYESFRINYKKYYTDSIDSAKWLVSHFNKYVELKDKKILDWGCGPARVIRHLPSIIGSNCTYYGTDYNKRSIDWCTQNITDAEFNCNSLSASLPYQENFFDIIYGISIFTHLSEQLHSDWYEELYRILSPNGIMFLTTQGDNFKVKLTNSELEKYNDGKLIIRGKVKEGHRTYSAFHPPAFMKKLFSDVEILEHIVRNNDNGKWIPQDIWIIKKKN